jgi:hypothetical protein
MEQWFLLRIASPLTIITTITAATTINITVKGPTPHLPPIATNYVGFSLEVYNVLTMIGAGAEPTGSYVQLMRNLHDLSGAVDGTNYHPHAG